MSVTLIPIAEVALRLGIAEKTARNWITRGVFPVPTVKLRRKLLVASTSLDDFLQNLISGESDEATLPQPVAEKRGRGRPRKLRGEVKS